MFHSALTRPYTSHFFLSQELTRRFWIMDFNRTRKLYPGMWQYPRNGDHCCIYRVPKCIRDGNPEAYTPQLVLIGPLHHSLKSQACKSLDHGDDMTHTKSMGYLNMEEHKKIYLAEFAQRFEGGNIIDVFRRTIEEDEEIIRASYSESTAWIQSQEFVEMVLHDSVFIFVFMGKGVTSFKITQAKEKVGDPLIDEPCLRNAIISDLVLLENQLPYFILGKLFDPIIPRIRGNQKTLRELFIAYFGFTGKIGNNTKFRHITDMYRSVHVETLSMRKHDKGEVQRAKGEGKRIQHMYNADKLDSGGVKFKAEGDEFSLNVTFENGCLKMPCLTIHDQFEMILRNIMALEQCHYRFDPHVCNYVVFLDYLIDTEKDVDLLVEKGIIKNWTGHPALVARMVDRLGFSIFENDSYYSDIADEVNAYYSNPVTKSKAILKRVYFGNLWTGTATIAATLLLVMTLIQTVASIIQVIQGSS